MDPPSPPSFPPPTPGLEVSFSVFMVVAIAAAGAAIIFLILQWCACAYLLPAQDAYIQRMRKAQEERRAAEEAWKERRRAEARETEELAQVAPPPRVRTVSFIGSLEDAARPPPEDAPTHHKPTRRVHPTPPPSQAATHERDGYSKDIAQPTLFSAVICSPFVIGQTLTGGAIGFGLTFGIFTLMLSGGGPYPLISPETLIMLCVLPPLSGFFTPLFTPLAMPEAAARRWLGYVEPGALPAAFMCMPFLHARWAVARLLLLAVFTSALWIPTGYAVLAFALSPPYAAADLTLFAGLYVVAISVVVMPFGVLGHCIEPNFERVMEHMSSDKHRMNRLFKRLSSVFLC